MQWVIDSGSLFNIILQMKFKEIGLADGLKLNRKPKTNDGHSLQICLEYAVFLSMIDFDDRISQDNIPISAPDIGGFDFILVRLWLHNVPPIIHRDIDHKMYQSSHNISSPLDIVLLNVEEFQIQCYENNSHAVLKSIVDYLNSNNILLRVEEVLQIRQEY